MMGPVAISLFTIIWLRLKWYPLIFHFHFFLSQQELHNWRLPGQYWTENKEEDRCAYVIINSVPMKSHCPVRHDISRCQPELKGMCWESHSGQQHANVTLLMRRHTSKVWQQLHPWRKANQRQTNKQRATQIESLIAHAWEGFFIETKQDLKEDLNAWAVFLCRDYSETGFCLLGGCLQRSARIMHIPTYYIRKPLNKGKPSCICNLIIYTLEDL